MNGLPAELPLPPPQPDLSLEAASVTDGNDTPNSYISKAGFHPKCLTSDTAAGYK